VIARRLAIALALAALLAAAPGTAQAKPRHGGKLEVQRANISGFAYLGKRDGYDLHIYLPDDRVAIFSVSRFARNGGSFAEAISAYAVRDQGSLARGVIRARLGSLGRIALRFRPNGKVRKRPTRRDCEGRPALTEYGTFIGHVEFNGEGGYLHASSTRGPGKVDRSFRLKCKKGAALDLGSKSLREYAAPGFGIILSSDHGIVSLLDATGHDHGRSIWIKAAHQAGAGPGAEVWLGTLESQAGMAIGRGAYVEGVPGTLLTSLPGAHPATATLAPPAPFFGEAHYLEKSATSHSWTGDLGVNLPGLTLPLTGSGFYTSLCVVSPLKVPDGCDFLKPKPLEPER
jgi:hypothetical protein